MAIWDIVCATIIDSNNNDIYKIVVDFFLV